MSYATIHEALNENGLDYSVETVPVTIPTNDLFSIENTPLSSNAKATVMVRNGTRQCVLGVNGPRFSPLSPIQAFGWLDNLKEAFGDSTYIKEAGLVNNQAFVRVRLGSQWADASFTDWRIERELWCIDSYDGKSQTTYMLRDYLPVCSNGMAMWTANSQFKVPHTASNEQKLKLTSGKVINAISAAEAQVDELKSWHETPIMQRTAELIYTRVICDLPTFEGAKERLSWDNEQKTPKGLNLAMNLYKWGPGHDRGTLWGVMQGMTNYLTHHHGSPEGRELAFRRIKQRRMERVLFDCVRQVKTNIDNGLIDETSDLIESLNSDVTL